MFFKRAVLTSLVFLCLIAGCATFAEVDPPTSPSASEAADMDLTGMVLIPAGPFYMGLSSEQADLLVQLECARYLANELPITYSCIELYDTLAAQSPQHVVLLDAFYIDQYEVTNDQYRECTETGPCRPPMSNYFFVLDDHGDHPVNAVSQQQAETYCQWLGKRLPTEAEWEKAARGTDGRVFPWGNTFDASRANLCDFWCPQVWADPNVNDGWIATAPADSYSDGASPYGVYNMVGNVWEWTTDWFSEDYYAISPAENPTGPDHGAEIVARGGGFYTSPGGASAASRTHDYWTSPPRHSFTIGFRCAVDGPAGDVGPDPLPSPPASPPRSPAPGDGVSEGWAVLAAQESYGGLSLMEDQVAGFDYLDALWEALIRHGWAPDNIHVIRDAVDRDRLTAEVEWLADSVDGDDMVFFYYSGQGRYLDLYLRWHAFFPPLWAEVPGRRMLLVDACHGGYFARAASGDGGDSLLIGSVEGKQCSWFGRSGDGTEIVGPAFTHYFVAGLDEPRADLDGDDQVSVQEAAIYADLMRRTYVRETIFAVAEFYERFVIPWEEEPVEIPNYPSMWMGDSIGEPIFFALDQ